ncbi:MAG: transposase, partial [Cyanobacteria bacterium J06555_12]
MSRLPQVANAHRKSYVSDLSDAEWELLASWLPAPKGFGRPRTVDLQEIMNGVFYGNGHTIADISATFT